jgi:peroxiredoxin
LILIAAALILIVASLALLYDPGSDEQDETQPQVDPTRTPVPMSGPAPNFRLPTSTGDTVSLSDYRGQYVLINFWATWCPPCLIEMPELQSYYREHRDQNFVLLAVNFAEDDQTVSNFLAESPFDFPILLDHQGTVYDVYSSGDVIPLSILVDPQGNVVNTGWREGRLTYQMIDEVLTPLLEG